MVTRRSAGDRSLSGLGRWTGGTKGGGHVGGRPTRRRRARGDMTLTETAVVTFTLTGLEHARGRGRLLGLANAEVVVEGVTITVQGIRVVHDDAGALVVQPPRFRHPDGRWLPAVVLPQELEEAIAAEVLRAFSPGAG